MQGWRGASCRPAFFLYTVYIACYETHKLPSYRTTLTSTALRLLLTARQMRIRTSIPRRRLVRLQLHIKATRQVPRLLCLREPNAISIRLILPLGTSLRRDTIKHDPSRGGINLEGIQTLTQGIRLLRRTVSHQTIIPDVRPDALRFARVVAVQVHALVRVPDEGREVVSCLWAGAVGGLDLRAADVDASVGCGELYGCDAVAEVWRCGFYAEGVAEGWGFVDDVDGLVLCAGKPRYG